MYGFLGSYPSECNDCAEEANWRVPQVPEDPADTPQRRRREGACTGYLRGWTWLVNLFLLFTFL